MTLGSSIYKEVPESPSEDMELSTANDQLENFQLSKPSNTCTKAGISSTNGVHELLECTVCTKLMYPPIHQVFNCFGQQFCLHFEAFLLGVAPVYMAFLRFMGDENEAKNFSYSQEVGGNGRKLTWQGVPRSIRDNHRKVRDNYDGLVIHRNMALFFSGGNRQELKLRVTGRIWKEQ